MRTLQLPPMSDRKELAAAVNFQAQDQVPMPLANAVLDFHPLGVIETPDGPRERVVLVAAQRDMIESLLDAVRTAGLQPEGVDLSAFALIRSLYRPGAVETGRVLYLNVDGLTNLAIADGPVCSFTRVVGSGLEGMASELAERRGIPVASARELIAEFDLDQSDRPSSHPHSAPAAAGPAVAQDAPPPAELAAADLPTLAAAGERVSASEPPGSDAGGIGHAALETETSYAELAGVNELEDEPPVTIGQSSDEDIRAVVENGVREIAGEVRNSLDFHRSQDGAARSRLSSPAGSPEMPGSSRRARPTSGWRSAGPLWPGRPRRLRRGLHAPPGIAAGLAAEEVHG
jgi:Tfp pilus assembly PilM family ATPase